MARLLADGSLDTTYTPASIDPDSGNGFDRVLAIQPEGKAIVIVSSELDVDFNEPGIEDRIASTNVVQRELAAQDDLLTKLEQIGAR